MAAQVHFAVHGAPYIKGVREGIIDNIVRAVSDFIQRLGVVESAFLFFKHKDAVSFRVVHKIDGSVAGNKTLRMRISPPPPRRTFPAILSQT